MNTPAHLIFGLAAFGRPDAKRVTVAAIAGAMIPDLSLYLMAGWHLSILGTQPEIVFEQLYFSEAWQSVFRIDNSIILWGIAFVLSMMGKSRVGIALCGAALLHLGLDFLLHHDDARAHFWPSTNWKFQSPVSYWDPKHYGHIVGPVEIILSLMACVFLWTRFLGRKMRALIIVLGLAEFAPVVAFALMFKP